MEMLLPKSAQLEILGSTLRPRVGRRPTWPTVTSNVSDAANRAERHGIHWNDHRYHCFSSGLFGSTVLHR